MQIEKVLRTNSHGSRLDCADYGSLLLWVEDSSAVRVTVQTVASKLEQCDLVLVVLGSQGNITSALEPIRKCYV